MTIKVKAPSDLEAGYTFEATVDNKVYNVTVPKGGVKSGEEFDAEATEIPVVPDNSRDWKFGICDFCSTCPFPCLLASCGCHGIVAGQVLQRMKYNFIGLEGGYKNTCMIMTLILLGFVALTGITARTERTAAFVYTIYVIYLLVAIMLARNNMRKKYKIKGSCCGDSMLDDCCCAYFCGCCSILQMHRETHDEKQYKYDITSRTGLPSDAPEIV